MIPTLLTRWASLRMASRALAYAVFFEASPNRRLRLILGPYNEEPVRSEDHKHGHAESEKYERHVILLRHRRYVIEHVHRQLDALRGHRLAAARAYAGGTETA